MGFLDFLNTMQGRYHEATFQEKRNALDVLGAKVYIHPDPTTAPDKVAIESGPEWLSVAGAAELTELAKRTLCQRLQYGQLPGRKNPQTRTWLIHRDDLVQFLEDSRIRPKTTEEHIEERVEVTYSPKFTGV
ncbi:helix-turn-helix domain-containing protein [Ktedonobacter racemifer]|uniref:Helix-turn-helix domain-containing protein n=1 Tax=Ktedonobacter racemifer DSM 44963 TaxID=485913 RepID=D6TQH9_KTERA|nr:helix-turn-helix domain-containing protein [Ktedonobacter racemifer]EFH87646.1 hypothetical protein Krac_8990 [Ktedonobacter racemifer DSM 44963]